MAQIIYPKSDIKTLSFDDVYVNPRGMRFVKIKDINNCDLCIQTEIHKIPFGFNSKDNCLQISISEKSEIYKCIKNIEHLIKQETFKNSTEYLKISPKNKIPKNEIDDLFISNVKTSDNFDPLFKLCFNKYTCIYKQDEETIIEPENILKQTTGKFIIMPLYIWCTQNNYGIKWIVKQMICYDSVNNNTKSMFI